MSAFSSRLAPASEGFRANRDGMLQLVERLRQLQSRTVAASAKSGKRFAERGQLLPRERLALLLDSDAPFLELMALAGYCGGDDRDPETSVPGAAVIAGIGSVAGVRAMVVASDSGIQAGAMQQFTAQKVMRCQEIALRNRLPFIHLIESAGGNLLTYKVERFIAGGGQFRNLALLSAAGLPVLAVVHGSSTAGGAYLPGLSDYVVMVRGNAKAFLAGPPLVKAATGEIATEEELGGSDMHASISGLADYVADDDAQAVGMLRGIVGRLGWDPAPPWPGTADGPALPADQIAGTMPLDFRQPVDMREVVARIVDRSELSEYRPAYGQATLCIHAFLDGHPTAFITNNGPLDPQGATKAATFIQLCGQSGTPIVYLQNTTGFIVGRGPEEAGMIKHGSKMIQALTNARVPQVTIMCGASFGAGNYGMCGRAFAPRFLFSWPNARSAIMGGEQAAMTMTIVREAAARRRGIALDKSATEAEARAIIDNIDGQSDAFHTSGLLLDDGVIDPRDTRTVLSLVLQVCRDGDARATRPVQYGVARF